MRPRTSNITFGFLSLTGILLLSMAYWHVAILPASQACGNRPNCETWNVMRWECSGPCSCAGNLIAHTCYNEIGTCVADGSSVIATNCFRGNCCCPSGNCAGQGGGGGGGPRGGGGPLTFNGVGESCDSDWDCDTDLSCDQSSGTCQY